MKYILAVLLTIFVTSINSQLSQLTYQACEDKRGTERCVRLKKMYSKLGITMCAGPLKHNCARTCKLCKPPPFCEISKYGCCWDKLTPARGPGDEGCPYCHDRKRSLCKSIISRLLATGRMSKKQACSYGWTSKNCPQTCGACGLPAMAYNRCFQNLYGCCWNYKPARGINGQGCDECEDTYPHTCKQFDYYCNKEGLNEKFMRMHCPLTCGRCIKGQLLLDYYLKRHKK